MRGTDMLSAVREVQIPLLAVLLICGFAAKARRAIARSPAGPAAGPVMMFPARLRGPAVIGVSGTELILGTGLVVTADGAGGSLALWFRMAAAVLFATAAAALHELRARRPDAGCGCFGDFSGTPVSWRSIARAVLLCAAALATIGAPSPRLPGSPARAGLTLAVTLAELAALTALSPEAGAILARLGRAEPCELRRVPVTRTMEALRASSPWQRYRAHLISTEPIDVWREGCWRFLVFPAVRGGRRVEVVFAVYLEGRRDRVRAGVLDADAPSVPAHPATGL